MKTRYLYNHPPLSDPWYRKYKSMIENDGFIRLKRDVDEVKVYDPFLFMILTTVDLPVRNLETNEDTTINGFDLLPVYIQGYNEGREHFEKEFQVTPDTLYKNPAYIKNLLYHYNGSLRKRGWEAIKRSHPLMFNQKFIRQFGFDSGIASMFDELKEKHPALFTAPDQPEEKKPLPALDDSKKTELIQCLDSLLNFSINNINRKTIESILSDWEEALSKKTFDLKEYAALYWIIYDNHRDWFKKGKSFSAVQNCFDRYFGIDTTSYKPSKLKDPAEKLKKDYPWTDKI